MIYFTIPSSSGLVGTNTNIYVDRDPKSNSTLNLHSYESTVSTAAQFAPNGINIRNEEVSISLKNITAATALLINNYFKLIKTGNLTLVYPEGSKNYHVIGWNINIKNSLYADLTATLELMYL